MKRKLIQLMVVAMGLFCFGGIPAVADEITVDEDKLREIVKEVIKENPELIFNTVNGYIRKQREEEQEKQLEASFKKRIKVEIDKNTPVRGPNDAPITIVEYADFQCPYCSKGSKTVMGLLKKYPGKIRLAFRNNPLNFHEQAMPAAKAALAAHKQEKFWEYYDLLFKNSSKLDETMFLQFAEDLKLDVKKFNTDRESEEIETQIVTEQAFAKENNMTGTPAFIVNGVVIKGAQNEAYFVKIIDRLLAEENAEKKEEGKKEE